MDEIVKLKAHAYDCLVSIEAWQIELKKTVDKIKNITEEQSNVPKS
jgi:hypothetical protein